MEKHEILETIRYILKHGDMSYPVRFSLEDIVKKLESDNV